MADETNLDPIARRAVQIEEAGKKAYGEANWKAAMDSLTKKMADGAVSQAELVHGLSRPDAAAQLFNNNIADSDEKSWREWRDSQPRRKSRIEATKR
jgi:hypothetical protein